MSDPWHTIGQLAQLACTWEVLARKAGNVCPGREFPDLTVNDFLVSAAAIAPVLEQAPQQPLGVTILRCIEETRKVVNTNTNLGIVLLLAPLASVPLDQPLKPGLRAVLRRTTVEDARNAYAAIRLAEPGGLGEVKEQDVLGEPTLPLRDVMALAMERDAIAAQYVHDFAAVRLLAESIGETASLFHSVEKAIVQEQLLQLGTVLDSLVLRKSGREGAMMVKSRAEEILSLGGTGTFEGRQAFFEFDAWLRSKPARNPGTLADLIAAALYVALREKEIAPTMPFTWHEHPFQMSEPDA